MEHEYIVTVNRGQDWQEVHTDIVSQYGNDVIPQRSVDVVKLRPGSNRNTHYSLTDAEAQNLRSDPRILAVERTAKDQGFIPILKATQTGSFPHGTGITGTLYDWAKIRHSSSTNPYSTGSGISTGQYNYNLDGTGVDVVIQDSGLQVDHPEFTDASGASRVVQHNWYTASGLSGTQSSNHYRDRDGHGTHCAGTAVGKTFGWAKGAQVYSQKVAGLEGSGDSGTGIDIDDCFDTIKEWHRSKTNGRPTVVNMSWGYGGYFQFNASLGHTVTYRGTTYSGTDVDSSTKRWAFGLSTHTWTGSYYAYNVRVTSVDADIQELIDAGVHVCIAAGNRGYNIADPSSQDYNNIVTAPTYNFPTSSFNTSASSFYYMRGSSPFDDEAFIVGALDMLSSTEAKTDFSEAGPGVDIYAGGQEIISSMSTTNRFSDANYHANSNYKQGRIDGTSMASPQVAGVCALALQSRPDLTPQELKQLINSVSTTGLLTDAGSSTFDRDTSIFGGNNRILFNRYNFANALTIS